MKFPNFLTSAYHAHVLHVVYALEFLKYKLSKTEQLELSGRHQLINMIKIQNRRILPHRCGADQESYIITLSNVDSNQ